MNGVDTMIMLGAGNARKEILLGIGFVIPVRVGEDHDPVTHRNDHLVSENAHAMRGINVPALIKGLHLVRLVVSVRILEN